jgi:hypothetical protein
MSLAISPANLIAVAILAGAQFGGGSGGLIRWSFEDDAVGQVPKLFREEVGKWRVVEAEGQEGPGSASRESG